MTYATDDAERSSACEILYACRGKIASDIQQEASRGHPDVRRLADLGLVMSQLRNDIVAVRAGDRAVTTRVRVMYGAPSVHSTRRCPLDQMLHHRITFRLALRL